MHCEMDAQARSMGDSRSLASYKNPELSRKLPLLQNLLHLSYTSAHSRNLPSCRLLKSLSLRFSNLSSRNSSSTAEPNICISLRWHALVLSLGPSNQHLYPEPATSQHYGPAVRNAKDLYSTGVSTALNDWATMTRAAASNPPLRQPSRGRNRCSMALLHRAQWASTRCEPWRKS